LRLEINLKVTTQLGKKEAALSPHNEFRVKGNYLQEDHQGTPPDTVMAELMINAMKAKLMNNNICKRCGLISPLRPKNSTDNA
jgi:hypothetical protein